MRRRRIAVREAPSESWQVTYRDGGFDKLEAGGREFAVQHMGFLIGRRKDLWRKGRAEGSKGDRRRRR